MSSREFVRRFVLCSCMLLFAACALMPARDPLQVTVAGLEPLEGEGLEMRMLVKLRVQNPNERPLDYQGVAVQMDVQGKRFASGVSAQGGNIPGFSESIIAIPVSISTLSLVRQAIGMAQGTGGGGSRIVYEMRGKLSSAGDATRFSAKGDVDLPMTGARATTD